MFQQQRVPSGRHLSILALGSHPLGLNSQGSSSCLPPLFASLGPKWVCIQLPKSLEKQGLYISGSQVQVDPLLYTCLNMTFSSPPQPGHWKSVTTERDFLDKGWGKYGRYGYLNPCTSQMRKLRRRKAKWLASITHGDLVLLPGSFLPA